MATEACRNGRVKVSGHAVKPSHEVKENEIVTINLHSMTRTVRVKELLKNRVSAALVTNYLEDLTPQEEYDKLKAQHDIKPEFRPRGTGRPTKKERRLIERLKKLK